MSSKTKTSLFAVLAVLLMLCMVGAVMSQRPRALAENETAAVINYAAGKDLIFYTPTPETSALERVQDETMGEVNKVTFSSASDIAYVLFDMYKPDSIPSFSRITNFGTGVLEFRLKYKAENIVPEANLSGDPRSGGISMYVSGLGMMDAEGNAANPSEIEFWDWRALPEGGNVMCQVIKSDSSEWTELVYQFELQADKHFKQLRLNLQSTFGATGTVYFTDFELTDSMTGELIPTAERDVIGTDTDQAFVDRWYTEGGLTKAYDENVRYHSNVNGSLKLTSDNIGSDMNAFLVLSNQDFVYNTSYTVTFYIKGENLSYGDWAGWPLGINVYNRYFYRDNPQGDPVYLGELLNEPYMKSGDTLLTPKAFDAIEAGNKGMPSNTLQNFDWIKVQYTINPWVIWTHSTMEDGSLHPEYFVYLGLRIYFTSGNIWVDDVSIVPSGCQLPVYVSQEPTMSIVGQLPEITALNGEMNIPKVTAYDKNNQNISSSAKVTVTAPDGSKILENADASVVNKLVPDQKGTYHVSYLVEDAYGVSASLEQSFTVDEVRMIRADVEPEGIRSRNYEIAQPTVYEPDGSTVVEDAEVNVVVKSPSGTVMWDDLYDTFFGVAVTPSTTGDHILTYEYTYEKDGQPVVITATYVFEVKINPLDIGQGDYDDNYVPGGHFEDVTTTAQLVSDTQISYYPDDATKVVVNLKTDGGYSGNNYMQVEYKTGTPEASSWFYMIDLTKRPVLKDNQTKYVLQFYIRCSVPVTAATENDQFVLRIELKKDTVTQGISSCLYTDIYFTADQINAMTDWTLVQLEWISLDDAFVFGDAELPSGENLPVYHRPEGSLSYDTYTCVAFGFFASGDIQGVLDFDDITFVKEGDEVPDYKSEYENKEPAPPESSLPETSDEPQPPEGCNGCGGMTGLGGNLSLLLVGLGAAVVGLKKRKNQ